MTNMLIYFINNVYYLFINHSSFSMTTEQSPFADEGHEMRLKPLGEIYKVTLKLNWETMAVEESSS